MIRFVPALCLFLAVCLNASTWATPATSAPAALESAHFRLEIAPADARMARRVLDMAESARKAVLEVAPKPLEQRFRLVWAETEAQFYRHLDRRRGHVLAAAESGSGRIFINGEQMRRLDRAEAYRTLVHEFTHIYLGRIVPFDIPVWLNEGLAMHIAGEWGLDDSIALASHSTFGGLLALEEIEDRFPTDAVNQRLAYLQSYSLTAFLIRERFARTGLRGLLADLAQPDGLVSRLLENSAWKQDFAERWESQWLGRGRMVIAVTSWTTFWVVVAVLVVLAYLKKRRQRKQTEARWALEEEFTYHSDEFDD